MRRVPTQIILTLLGSLEAGAVAKTHLMYRANLDSRALKRYLAFLTEKGLVADREFDGRTAYVLTEKGMDFLIRYRDLEGVFS